MSSRPALVGHLGFGYAVSILLALAGSACTQDTGGDGTGGRTGSGGVGVVNGTGGWPGTGGALGSGGAAGIGSGGMAGGSTGGSGAGGSAGAGSGGAAGSPAGSGGASGGGAAIETITVPAGGASVPFTTSLTDGALYLLKASGTVVVGDQLQDAEFASGSSGTGAMDSLGGTDVGIDVGLLQIHAPNGTNKVAPGPGRMKWFGGSRADHTYYMIVTGPGHALTLKLVASGAGSSGGIVVSLFMLAATPPATDTPTPGPKPTAPAPPRIGTTARETLQIPAVKTVIHTAQNGETNAVYLIQASSAVRVGGGGAGLGDADYDDWNATGAGANNNVGACDFGVGVDETTTCSGPRARWWGPYRNDHVYFMLYTGTGNPLSLLYYDSGYGDNTPTDTITLSIFPAP